MLRAALIDVGGTLWPERGPWLEQQAHRLHGLLSRLDPHEIARLVQELNEPAQKWESPTSVEQDTQALVNAVLTRNGLDDVSVRSVIEAMCVPAWEGAELFPGAGSFLRTVRELGLRIVLVSNTAWRDAQAYERDFEYFELDGYIDGIVTSLDLKIRKPHESIFRAAINLAGCLANECLFIGDSEEKDIVPAVKLGMRTMLVAIESPPPSRTVAETIATSLEEAGGLIRDWMTEQTKSQR